MNIPWWIWLVASLGLMIAELLLPTGFFVFFFGVGGVVTALLIAAGLLTSFESQGLAFIGISLACVVLLRKVFLVKFHVRNSTHAVDSLVGQMAQTLETIEPHAIGKVELQGSSWAAQNVGSVVIPVGTRCTIAHVHGITLHVTL